MRLQFAFVARVFLFFVSGFLFLCLLSESSPVLAQTPAIDTRSWRPSSDPRSQWLYEPTEVPGPWVWGARALFSYEYNSVQVKEASTGQQFTPIQHAFRGDLSFNVGLGDRFAAGLSLPLAFYQTGDSSLPPNLSSRSSVSSFALGDMGLHGKVSLLANPAGGLGMAALLTATFPTGDRESFIAAKSVSFTPRLLVDYSLWVGGVQGSLGYMFYANSQAWPNQDKNSLSFGGSLPYSLGVYFKPLALKIDDNARHMVELGLRGSIPFGPTLPFDKGAENLSFLMIGISDRVELGAKKKIFLLSAVDVSILHALGAPNIRFSIGVGYNNFNVDADGDGIEDDQDECKDVPEDKDHFDDTDGCPDIDNDSDGVLDDVDLCPNRPGILEEKGCPDKDDDGDGILNHQDACPHEKGVVDSDPNCNGCNL